MNSKKSHQAWRDAGFGEVPTGFDIHHKDGNHDNDDISNLVMLSHSDHTILHRTGKRHTEETKRLISEKKRGAGHKHTEETKRKMSESRKGITYSPETIRRMSDSHKGKKYGPETKAKLSVINKGKKISEEQKKKIREALLSRGEEIRNAKKVSLC